MGLNFYKSISLRLPPFFQKTSVAHSNSSYGRSIVLLILLSFFITIPLQNADAFAISLACFALTLIFLLAERLELALDEADVLKLQGLCSFALKLLPNLNEEENSTNSNKRLNSIPRYVIPGNLVL